MIYESLKCVDCPFQIYNYEHIPTTFNNVPNPLVLKPNKQRSTDLNFFYPRSLASDYIKNEKKSYSTYCNTIHDCGINLISQNFQWFNLLVPNLIYLIIFQIRVVMNLLLLCICRVLYVRETDIYSCQGHTAENLNYTFTFLRWWQILIIICYRIGKRPGSGGFSNTPATKVIKTEPEPAAASNSRVSSGLFSNDGNFLERFKRMQEMQSGGIIQIYSGYKSL